MEIEHPRLNSAMHKGWMLVLACAVYACALLDRYQDNLHAFYDRQLTDEEKEIILNQGELQKNWKTPQGQGAMLITSLEEGKEYNFVEIGDWVEEFSYERGGLAKRYVKRETEYDSHGNILERTTWERGKSSSTYCKLERWSSYYSISGKDTVGLVQKITTFHENGAIQSKQKVFIEQFRCPLSDRLKTKYYMDTVLVYNEEGTLINEKIYSLSNKDRVK